MTWSYLNFSSFSKGIFADLRSFRIRGGWAFRDGFQELEMPWVATLDGWWPAKQEDKVQCQFSKQLAKSLHFTFSDHGPATLPPSTHPPLCPFRRF